MACRFRRRNASRMGVRPGRVAEGDPGSANELQSSATASRSNRDSSKAQDVRTAIARRNPNRMMRFTATRSTAFCAPGARSGGLGSLRVEAIGFRQREQTGARVLTSLPQAGQEIDAISAQSLSRQFPLQGSVNARQNESGAALRLGRLRNTGELSLGRLKPSGG